MQLGAKIQRMNPMCPSRSEQKQASMNFLLDFSPLNKMTVSPNLDNSKLQKNTSDHTPVNAPPHDFDPYKSSRFVGHSLWMIPTGSALKVYDEIVGTTARQLGTFHFLPHVTLVAALMAPVQDVIERTRHLATLLAPYEFELDDLSQKDAYFQCVFATMKRTDAVVDANETARQVFEEKRLDPPYMPHLSLIYGEFDHDRKTNEIIPKLREQLQERGVDTRRLPVDAIEIWSTQGDVKDWYLVERVPLVRSMEKMQ